MTLLTSGTKYGCSNVLFTIISKDPDYTQNSLSTAYNHLLERQLRRFLSNEDWTRIHYVSKLIRVKYCWQGNKLPAEMMCDQRIEKDFSKEIFKSKNEVLPDFVKIISYEHFVIKSLRKNKHSRDYSPPSLMNILDEPNSSFGLSPPTYWEISKIALKAKPSGSACPFAHVSVIALKRCPILRSILHRIIVYCWQNNIPETWKRGFCVFIYKKVSPKQPCEFRPIILDPVCAKVLMPLIRNGMHGYLVKNN